MSLEEVSNEFKETFVKNNYRKLKDLYLIEFLKLSEEFLLKNTNEENDYFWFEQEIDVDKENIYFDEGDINLIKKYLEKCQLSFYQWKNDTFKIIMLDFKFYVDGIQFFTYTYYNNENTWKSKIREILLV